MGTDLNQKKERCFDNEAGNPKSLEQSQDTVCLDRLIKEYNKLPVDLRKKIKFEIDCKALSTEHPTIKAVNGIKEKKPKEKKLFFGCRIPIEILTILILEWDKEIHLLFDRSQVHVFVNMLISKDLSQFHEQLHLKCLSTEFKCIMEHLSLRCKSFNPTTIGRSNGFISSNGTVINASYLYNTSTEHLHNKELIEHIFKKHC